MTRRLTVRRAGAATRVPSGSRAFARRGYTPPPATRAGSRTRMPRRGTEAMRVELSHDFAFEAAHRLPMLPPDHKCARTHGHSWRVEVCVAGEVDERTGWLLDFGEIQQ